MLSRFTGIRSRIKSGMASQGGFTLVEIVVALSIVAIGILSVLAVSNFSVQATDENERKVVALNLAREGIEMVRSIRDSNWAIETSPPTENPARPWDCYATSAAGAVSTPFSCDRNFTTVYPESNYRVYPQLDNGVPFLVPITQSNTARSDYRICVPVTAGPPVYTPDPGPAVGDPCPAMYSTGIRSQLYYRRVRITRGKTLTSAAGTTYSARVQVFVSWPRKKGTSDVVLEEYITDWKE